MNAIELAKRVYIDSSAIDLDRLDYMGTIDKVYDVYFETSSRYTWVYLWDSVKERVAVEVPLSRRTRRGQVVHHPDYTKADSRYRGKGLALKVYQFLLKQGVVLQAGESQSAGSQKLWYKLSMAPNVEVWSMKGDKWQQCYPCDVTERVDAYDWDPYEVGNVTMAIGV